MHIKSFTMQRCVSAGQVRGEQLVHGRYAVARVRFKPATLLLPVKNPMLLHCAPDGWSYVSLSEPSTIHYLSFQNGTYTTWK